MGSELLENLGILIVAGTIFFLGAKRIRMPGIVAYLLAGLVVGPMLGLVEVTGTLDALAEAGIALLLFLVGLELSLDRIRDVGKTAIVAGLGQVVFTTIGGLLLCWWLGFTPMECLFLAVGLTFSSTVVVVKLLTEKGELDSLYGRIAVGIFLVQDMVVILVLTVLAGLDTGAGADGVAETDVMSVVTGLGLAFGGMLLLLAFALGAAKWLLPKPFAWAARSPETIFVWALGWCFLVVWLAHEMKLSLEIGAFLAGLGLAQLPYSGDLRRRVHPLMNFFIAVFFVALGVRMELGDAAEYWWPAVVLSLFVLLGNPFIFIWIIARMGYGERTTFYTSVTVAQISEFSFIFATAGVAAGLIGQSILSLTAVVGIITIAVSAYMILYNRQLYETLKRWGVLKMFGARQGDPDSGNGDQSRSGHIIVVGMNALGRELAQRLHQRGERVLAVDTDPGKLVDLPCDTMIGDAEAWAVLEEASLDHARLLVSTLHIEPTNDLLAFRCHQAGVPAAIHAVDLNYIHHLLDMDVAHLMVPKVDGVKRQRRHLREAGILKHD